MILQSSFEILPPFFAPALTFAQKPDWKRFLRRLNLSQKIILMIIVFLDCVPQKRKWLSQTTHHFMEKLRVCSLCPFLPTPKREMYASFINLRMNVNVHTQSEMSFISTP